MILEDIPHIPIYAKRFFDFTIKDEDGTPTDPGEVKIWIEQPDGKQTSYTSSPAVTNPETGTFRFTYRTTQAGIHFGRIECEDGSNNDEDAQDFCFVVDASKFEQS